MKETDMTTERLVRIFAGAFVLASLALGVEASPIFVSKHFLWFTLFVGANLFQSGFTRICPLESILRRFGVKSAVSLGRT
jgi:Inner membrane protein YgaP-like, transmembrane domain